MSASIWRRLKSVLFGESLSIPAGALGKQSDGIPVDDIKPLEELLAEPEADGSALRAEPQAMTDQEYAEEFLDPEAIEGLTEAELHTLVEDMKRNVRGALRHRLVALHSGVKVEVFSNEHPPPHFRVSYQGSCANFSLLDCSIIEGDGQVVRKTKIIRSWYENGGRKQLIKAWNASRPADCPVGRVEEP